MTKLRILLRWLAAVAAFVLAALLIWQCLDIHASGAAYTSEDVSARLQRLAWPAASCAVVMLLAAALRAGVPEGKMRAPMSPENRLRLMKARAAEMPEAARREERLRRALCVAEAAVLGLCAAFALACLLDGSRFVSWELEGVLGALLLQLLPWAGLALATAWGCGVLCDRSCLRECEALRGISGGKMPDAPGKPAQIDVVRAALYAAALVFIVLGVMNGGLFDVLVKAVNICTECIGLG